VEAVLKKILGEAAIADHLNEEPSNRTLAAGEQRLHRWGRVFGSGGTISTAAWAGGQSYRLVCTCAHTNNSAVAYGT
jgi:hypothetical protein